MGLAIKINVSIPFSLSLSFAQRSLLFSRDV